MERNPYGALDAFSHALETLWNKTAMPMSLSCAHVSPNLIMENLPILEQALELIFEADTKQALMHGVGQVSKSIAEPLLDSVHNSVTEQNLQHISVRSKLQEAAYIAGMAISQSHSSIGHSISYSLTLHYEIQHGLSCSAFLLPIMNLVEKYNAWMCPLDKEFDKEFKNNLRHFLQMYEPHKLVHEMFTPVRAGA